MPLLRQIADGRTDLVFDYLDAGNPATAVDPDGISLLKWCAYYGDVSAMRFLLSRGETIEALGENYDLAVAAFHGHWRLTKFLIERGASPNHPAADTGETALHSALCTANSLRHALVVRVLLAAGADPNLPTIPGVETGGFMRDSRTRGETPLHRAAAFATPEVIQMLLDAGARVDVRDSSGDTPLSWASWHLRPGSVLQKLCYGPFRIRPSQVSGESTMESNLLGRPHR